MYVIYVSNGFCYKLCIYYWFLGCIGEYLFYFVFLDRWVLYGIYVYE